MTSHVTNHYLFCWTPFSLPPVNNTVNRSLSLNNDILLVNNHYPYNNHHHYAQVLSNKTLPLVPDTDIAGGKAGGKWIIFMYLSPRQNLLSVDL